MIFFLILFKADGLFNKLVFINFIENIFFSCQKNKFYKRELLPDTTTRINELIKINNIHNNNYICIKKKYKDNIDKSLFFKPNMIKILKKRKILWNNKKSSFIYYYIKLFIVMNSSSIWIR